MTVTVFRIIVYRNHIKIHLHITSEILAQVNMQLTLP